MPTAAPLKNSPGRAQTSSPKPASATRSCPRCPPAHKIFVNILIAKTVGFGTSTSAKRQQSSPYPDKHASRLFCENIKPKLIDSLTLCQSPEGVGTDDWRGESPPENGRCLWTSFAARSLELICILMAIISIINTIQKTTMRRILISRHVVLAPKSSLSSSSSSSSSSSFIEPLYLQDSYLMHC